MNAGSSDSVKKNHWVFVFGWLTLGGAERQALRFAAHLKRAGSSVTVVGISNPGIAIDECRSLGIECHYWPLYLDQSRRHFLKRLMQFVWRLRQLKPTYIAPYCMPANLICGVTWRWTGARACVWQQRDEGRLRRRGLIEFLALRLTPAFISNSWHGRDWLCQVLGVPRPAVRVIRNGIDLPPPCAEFERADWRRAHDLPLDAFVVTMVANIHRYKDHMTLLRAWRTLLDKAPDPARLRLILAGRHENTYQDVAKAIIDLDLAGSVSCPGRVLDVPRMLAACDLVAFSSKLEGVPNAVLEGMAHGLPVVATDIPGVREALGDHDRRVLAQPDNSEQLAERLLFILNNPETAREIGQANLLRIRELFSTERMVADTVETFEAAARVRFLGRLAH